MRPCLLDLCRRFAECAFRFRTVHSSRELDVKVLIEQRRIPDPHGGYLAVETQDAHCARI